MLLALFIGFLGNHARIVHVLLAAWDIWQPNLKGGQFVAALQYGFSAFEMDNKTHPFMQVLPLHISTIMHMVCAFYGSVSASFTHIP